MRNLKVIPTFFFVVILGIIHSPADATAQSRNHEIGLLGATAGMIADVGNTGLFPVRGMALGALYRYNFNYRYALRAQISGLSMRANDAWSSSEQIRLRNLSVRVRSVEIASLFEFNARPFYFDEKFAHTPYLFAGLGLSLSTGRKFLEGVVIDSPAQIYDPAFSRETFPKAFAVLPVGVGYRIKTGRIVIGAEIGYRCVFSDNFDSSFPRSPYLEMSGEDSRQRRIGQNTLDWYLNAGLTLTWIFGRSGCYYCH